MLKVAICEDNAIYAQKLCAMIQNVLSVSFKSTVFLTGNAFLKACPGDECPFDIILMDIDLGPDSITGITLSQKINQMNQDAQIIYISQYLQYISNVYETKHTYFINKKQLDQFLGKALQTAYSNLVSIQNQYLHFEWKKQNFKVPQNEIIYMERILRTTEIHTKQAIFHTSERFPELQQKLSPAFALCHRSFMVNLNLISTLNTKEITFSNGTQVPVGRTYYTDIKKAFAQLMML